MNRRMRAAHMNKWIFWMNRRGKRAGSIAGFIYRSFIVIITITTLLIWYVTIYAANRTILNNSLQQTQTLANHANQVVSRNLEAFSEYMDRIASNTTILYELYTLQHPRNQTFSAYAITSSVRAIVGDDAAVDSVEICANSSARFTYKNAITKGSTSESSLIQKTMRAATGETVWSVQPKELRHITQSFLILSKVMKYDRYSNETAGYALMSIDCNFLDELCQLVNDEAGLHVFITDANGMIVSHPNILRRGEYFEPPRTDGSGAVIVNMDGEKHFMSSQIIDINGWHIYSAISYSNFQENMRGIILITLIVLVACIILCSLFSKSISMSVSTPINMFIDSMDHVGSGEFSIISAREDTSYCFSEFAQMELHFNNMQTRLVAYIDEIARYKAKESELMFLNSQAELDILQQQINSHFLSNILETIFWMAYETGETEISDIITALGKFFRANINFGLEYITVEAEINSLENYLYLQRIRYKKLNVIWLVDPEIRQQKIVKFILQPIVENAIVHGIEPSPNSGDITIRGYIQDDALYLQVADKGIGMCKSDLEALKNSMNNGDTTKRGIGLKNVHRRLRLYYGEEYGIEIESGINSGTCVTLKLPAN